MKKLTAVAAGVALAVGVLNLSACSPKNENTQTQVEKKVEQKQLTSGIELANMDTSVSPKEDFYLYTNGKWLEKTEIPADKSNYGSFTQLHDDAQKNLKAIIERASANKAAANGSDEQKLRDFYNSYMDEAKAEELGAKPIEPLFAKINAAASHDDIAAVMGELYTQGVGSPLGWYVNNDAKQSDQYAVYLYQSGLGLPDRDYYLKEDEKSEKQRAEYVSYITDMFTMAGLADAKGAAERILALETKLAEKQWTRVESRDANKRYNKYVSDEFAGYMGDFNWQAYAKATGLDKAKEVIASQNTYMQAFGEMFKQVPVATWKEYLAKQTISEYAGMLSKDFVDRNFAFYGTTLRGIEEQRPRWKKAVSGVDTVLGELLGRLYVAEHFKPEAKERMEVLVQNLIKGFEVGIKELEWMSEETKVQALEKLSKFTPKIGYPDKWKDYSNLEIKEGDLVGNYIRYNQWGVEDMLGKLGKPIDRTEWHMSPQTVNAYYNPVMNEIVFPAAILQPPFFNLEAEDAVNYGGIGAVIGHEIGHGFDDQGAKYDGEGNLRNWWTEQDKEQFQTRGKLFSEQYSEFEVFEGEFVNGDLTLGENIGDLGGLTIAYKAYQLSLDGKEAPVMDGYTGEQRVFLGWGQIWRRLYRDEELRNRLVTDPHSPSRYRVNGIVQNMPEFYQVFDIKEGDGHYLK
jgi:endothelin-converting enzyme